MWRKKCSRWHPDSSTADHGHDDDDENTEEEEEEEEDGRMVRMVMMLMIVVHHGRLSYAICRTGAASNMLSTCTHAKKQQTF